MVLSEILRRSNIEIVGYSPEFEEKTWRLYQKVFGNKTYSPYIGALGSQAEAGEIWRWKFPENGSLRLLAVKNGEVIGHIGAWMRKIDFLGNDIQGAELIEGFVDSLFRNGMALYLLVQKAQQELQSQGVQVAFLFPNQFSERLTLKRASSVREVFLLEKTLENKAIQLGQEASSPPRWEGFSQKATEIFERCLESRVIATRRTSEYFQWRYVQNPYETYFPIILPGEEGYAVLKIYNGEKAHLVDLGAKDKDSLGEILSRAERLASFHGAKTISTYPLCEPWTTCLREFRYQPKKWRTMAVITSSSDHPVVKNIDKWYLTMSEHNIF